MTFWSFVGKHLLSNETAPINLIPESFCGQQKMQVTPAWRVLIGQLSERQYWTVVVDRSRCRLLLNDYFFKVGSERA